MNVIAAPVVLLVLMAADGKPTPKVPVGKETTVATGPLDKEGYIDYEAALNERLANGITPEKNANVLLWKAFGPRPEGGKGMPAEFFKLLGIDKPPEKGDYFVSLGRYMKDNLKLGPNEFGALYEQQSRASQRPWAAEDYPHIAGWLAINEKPLALVIEAIRRPDYFNPLISPRSEKQMGGLISALLPSVQKCRELATALTARAMLRVHEGKFDQAWQDLLACHRLGRLVMRGASLIEALVGFAIDQVASNAELAYFEKATLTTRQVRNHLKDLEALLPLAPIADKIDVCERFMFLDCLQLIRRGRAGVLDPLIGDPTSTKPGATEPRALEKIDWEPAFRNGNRWYNRLVAILRLKDRAEREKQLDRFEEDLKALKEAADTVNVAKLLTGDAPAEKTSGKAIGNMAITLLIPAARKVQNAVDRDAQVQQNLYVAFALTAYHLDTGRYPTKLNELAPKYLPSVPNDLFSGKPLIYRPSENGYLFYSVGVNGKDEGGRWYDDTPPGDDPHVRIPLPELKPKK